MIQRVAGADDPLLHDYVALTDVALRRVREPVDGLFIAEGETVIRRALRADYTPRSFLLAERWLVGLDDIIASRPELPILVADEDVLQSVTGYSVHRGALASFHRPIEHALSEVVAPSSQPRGDPRLNGDQNGGHENQPWHHGGEDLLGERNHEESTADRCDKRSD